MYLLWILKTNIKMNINVNINIKNFNKRKNHVIIKRENFQFVVNIYILLFRKKQFRLSPRISPISERTISDFMTGLHALSFLWSFLENLFPNHKII